MGLFDTFNYDPLGYTGLPNTDVGESQGLLGGIKTWMKDPRNAQGLAAFGAALAKAGAPSRVPMGSFAGGLSEAFTAMNQARQGYDDQQLAKQMRDMQMRKMEQELNQKVDPLSYFGKIEAKDYTPESLQQFLATKNPSLLKPRTKVDIAPSGMTYNPYETPVGENLGKVEHLDLGGFKVPVLPNGQFKGAALPMFETPDSIARNRTTERGQNLTNARAADANSIANQNRTFSSETDMRKEFALLPEAKRYKEAYPAFKAIESSSQRDNPQADISLIYGVAKLYDPDSVVREGEYATIANSQAIPDYIKGLSQKLVGGGRLTKETKAQILTEARSRIGVYESEFNKAKANFSDIATQRGLNSKNIFTDTGAPSAKTVVRTGTLNGKKVAQYSDGSTEYVD